MATGFSLKDQLFNAEKVRHLADLFAAADARFDSAGFQAAVMDRLPELELKARINWIAQCLGDQLSGSLPEIAPTLHAALPPPLDPDRFDDDFGDFIFAPLGELVAIRGLEYSEASLGLLEAITQRFSMEWAVRPFLNHCPDQVLERMWDWARHESYHVRRLVSEGTRPRLPWGQGVDLDIASALPLLDELHADRTRYVTRSVANHLNDITKKDPDLAMDRLEAWRRLSVQRPDEMAWITRHALRGLIKAGHPRALKMTGFDPEAKIEVMAFDVQEQVMIGDALAMTAQLRAPEQTLAMVDYVFWRRKADGKLTPKVFKLKQVSLESDAPVVLTKLHRLKGDATTYRLYPGKHRIELQVNGRILATVEFDLNAP